jgi:hypothetical protein
VTAGPQPAPTGNPPGPARFLLLALLPLLGLFPPATREEALVGCAALVVLLAALVWRRAAHDAAAHALILALTAAAVVLACLAPVPAAAVEPVGLALLAAAVGLAAARTEGGEALTRGLALVLAAVTVGVALHGLYQWSWGLEHTAEAVRQMPWLPDHAAALARLERGRAFAGFATPAALGGFLALALPVTVGLALSRRGWRRGIALAAAALGAGAFLAAASVTAAVALLAAALLAAVAWSRARGALVAGALVVALALAGVFWSRGERVASLEGDESPWRLRAGNFRAAAAMSLEHPLVGSGPGGFAERYPAYRRPGDNETRHVHNLPLELAAEWGWPLGSAIAVLFFGLFLQPLWRERGRSAPWRRGVAVGLAAFALQNLADFSAFMPSVLWTATILRGRLAGAPRSAAPSGEPTAARTLAVCSLAAVCLAGVTTALGGLAGHERRESRLARSEDRPAVALRAAQRAARLAPWDVDAAVLLADLAVDAWSGGPGDEAAQRRAKERTERAVALAPTRASARWIRARLRAGRGDALGALVDLDAAARLHPAKTSYAAERDRLRSRLVSERDRLP